MVETKTHFRSCFFHSQELSFPTLIQHAEGGVSLTELKTATVQEPWTERAMWKTELVKMWIVFCPVCLVCFDVSVLRETNINIHKMLFQFVFWWFFLKVKFHPSLTCFGYGWFVTLTSRIFYILETVSGKCKRCLGVKFLIVLPFGHILGCARIRCTLKEDPKGSKFRIQRFMHVCAISSALESQSKPQIANLYYCMYSCFVVRLQQSFEASRELVELNTIIFSISIETVTHPLS